VGLQILERFLGEGGVGWNDFQGFWLNFPKLGGMICVKLARWGSGA